MADAIQVVELDKKDLSKAAEVIGLAFAENPSTLAMVGGDAEKAKRVMASAAETAKLRRRHANVLVALDNGQVVGVLNSAEWPRCQFSVGEKLRTMPMMIRILGRSAPKAMALMSAWSKHDPRKPHIHIGPVGVSPGLQGRGIGSKMLESCLAEADRRALPAYLEVDVDKNVSLYEKFGFVVIEEDTILGLRHRFMWREPVPRVPSRVS